MYKSHKDLLFFCFLLHPLLNPSFLNPCLILFELELYYPSVAQPLNPSPALPQCNFEMLMLIKSFILLRLISIVLLRRWVLANQIRPSGGPSWADGYKGNWFDSKQTCLQGLPLHYWLYGDSKWLLEHNKNQKICTIIYYFSFVCIWLFLSFCFPAKTE